MELVDLGGGIGAHQVAVLIAQQPQQGGGGLLQLDGLVRAEGAVAVAGDPALLHGHPDILRGPVAPAYVGKQGVVAGTGGDGVLIGGRHHQHLGKFRPVNGGGQVHVAVFVAGHNAESLDRPLDGGQVRPLGGYGHKAGQGHDQSEAEWNQSFHRETPSFVIHSAARRWG